ncbi:MAG: hypothetical protein U1F25_17620 [Rubrivivax sp.]
MRRTTERGDERILASDIFDREEARAARRPRLLGRARAARADLPPLGCARRRRRPLGHGGGHAARRRSVTLLERYNHSAGFPPAASSSGSTA